MNKESTNERRPAHARNEKTDMQNLKRLVERSAHVEHRGKEGEDMAYT